VLLAEAAETWQLYHFIDGNWANAQSTGNVLPPPPTAPPSGNLGGTPPPPPTVAREQLPAAVRLVVTLGGATLTRDIALGPQGS
jgi:hypothetical protein